MFRLEGVDLSTLMYSPVQLVSALHQACMRPQTGKYSSETIIVFDVNSVLTAGPADVTPEMHRLIEFVCLCGHRVVSDADVSLYLPKLSRHRHSGMEP